MLTLTRMRLIGCAVSLCLLAASDFVAAQSCAQIYTSCMNTAFADRDGCESQCDPGDQPCLDNCTSIFNQESAGCTNQQNTCLMQQQNYCTYYYCPIICGQSNPVTTCTYIDTFQTCTVVCSCDPYSRPNCPGGSSAASCNGGSWYCNSPLLIDMDGKGIKLTGCQDPVNFDLHGSGTPKEWTWTTQGAEEAWLVLDRNGNGTIDDGTEMFGSATEQAASESEIPNGFRALSAFDLPENGGDGDGYITGLDAVFSELRLWRDSNHDGSTQPTELTSLTDYNIVALDLSHQEVGRKDKNGNYLRFRARVFTADQGNRPIWSWDAFLTDCQEQPQ